MMGYWDGHLDIRSMNMERDMRFKYKNVRQTAAGLLLCDVCIFGEGLAHMIGLEKIFDKIFWFRWALGVFLLIYYFFINRAAVKEAGWFSGWTGFKTQDSVVKFCWLASLIVIGLNFLV